MYVCSVESHRQMCGIGGRWVRHAEHIGV